MICSKCGKLLRANVASTLRACPNIRMKPVPDSPAAAKRTHVDHGSTRILVLLSSHARPRCRRILKQSLATRYGGDGDTILVEELGLCRGFVRADIAVVNGLMKGFEIKSERDTLQRLQKQVEAYSRIFDTATIVVAGRHLR